MLKNTVDHQIIESTKTKQIELLNGIRIEYTPQACSVEAIDDIKRQVAADEYKENNNGDYRFSNNKGCEYIIGDPEKAETFNIDEIAKEVETEINKKIINQAKKDIDQLCVHPTGWLVPNRSGKPCLYPQYPKHIKHYGHR